MHTSLIYASTSPTLRYEEVYQSIAFLLGSKFKNDQKQQNQYDQTNREGVGGPKLRQIHQPNNRCYFKRQLPLYIHVIACILINF